MKRVFASLALVGGLVAFAPAASAGDKIIIPVFQSQSSVQNGSQNQAAAGGGSGNVGQSAGLSQSNQQSQTVNVYVPDDFRGQVKTTYIQGAPGGNRGNFGQGDLARRDFDRDRRDFGRDRRDFGRRDFDDRRDFGRRDWGNSFANRRDGRGLR